MGYTELNFQLPTDFEYQDLRLEISKIIKRDNFRFSIISKSLDARKKDKIRWQIRVGVSSSSISDRETPRKAEILELPDTNHGKGKSVTVIGCGPAGVFSALILQMSGFKTTIIEKGEKVTERTKGIVEFKKTGILKKNGGYCFGEGGAGTFSDGKLTSRTKSISAERQFIFEQFVKAGAPEEILYLKHPHLGSDNLKKIFPSIVSEFKELGGSLLFNTEVTDISHSTNSVQVTTIGANSGTIDSNFLIVAPGHSSFNLYRLLIKTGIKFINKPFAIGFRVEHLQEEINLSQWNKPSLPGVKAAEYSLAAKLNDGSAFTFCNCPGGKIVQASPKQGLSVVNGMSDYSRNSKFANSAVVTGFNIEEIAGDISPLRSLDILENMERKFYKHTGSFDLPAVRISDLINKNPSGTIPGSSYSFNLVPSDFKDLFDSRILNRLIEGLKVFNRKLKYFSNGTAMGLESKTSAPLRTLRNSDLSSPDNDNIYIAGEGSGNAGGIVSSAADGIKAALSIAKKAN